MDKTVIKAFSLLEVLAKSDVGMGVTELATATDIGKSNVHRLLQTLRGLGYVSAENGVYRATLRMWELGSYAHQRSDLRETARGFMEHLSSLTAETVHLSELDGFEVLYVDKIDSREPVRAYTQLGGRSPAYCTATGKVILAYQASSTIDQCYENVRRFTPNTIVELEVFHAEAQRIRSDRVAVNRGEWREDIMGVASPIAGQDGRVFAAIGISGPTSRLQSADLAAAKAQLVRGAEAISQALGCSPAAWTALDHYARAANLASS